MDRQNFSDTDSSGAKWYYVVIVYHGYVVIFVSNVAY